MGDVNKKQPRFLYSAFLLGCLASAACTSTPTPSAENPPTEVVSTVAITDDYYNQTFAEIEGLIEELNTIIAQQDYDKWLTFLTAHYIEKTSEPEYLKRWNNDKILKEKGLTVETLKDYFYYLVVPRRTNAKLDAIEFIDSSHVYAYTVLNGKKYLLFYLVKTKKGWKIEFY